jgi:hypothetical protein
MSLQERILTATAEYEVRDLLAEGAGYENASDKTRRRWDRAAKLMARVFIAEKNGHKRP